MNIPNSNAISGNEIMGIKTSHNCEKEFCSICQEEINLQNEIYEPTIYKLEECGHCFHINCIITWFRAGNTNCPNCGDDGTNGALDRHRSVYWSGRCNERNSRYLMIRRYARNKNAPKRLKNVVEKLIKLEKKQKESNKKYNELRNHENKYTIKESEEISSKYRNEKWKMIRKINKVKYTISTYPIIPIVIPKIKYINKPMSSSNNSITNEVIAEEDYVPPIPSPPEPHSDEEIQSDNVIDVHNEGEVSIFQNEDDNMHPVITNLMNYLNSDTAFDSV